MTSLDNIKFLQQPKNLVEDTSKMSNQIIEVTDAEGHTTKQGTPKSPENLKVQFRPGFFDARPKTGSLNVPGPLSERTA